MRTTASPRAVAALPRLLLLTLPWVLAVGCIPSRQGFAAPRVARPPQAASANRRPATPTSRAPAAAPTTAGKPAAHASAPATTTAAPASTAAPAASPTGAPATPSVASSRAPTAPTAAPAAPAAPASGPTTTVEGAKTAAALPLPASPSERANGYIQMSGEACEQELKRRGVPYASAAGRASGVDRPVRLTGPLRGVQIHAPGPKGAWYQDGSHEALDCRLALALDDLAGLLLEHDIVEAVQLSFYRKNARIAGRGSPSQHASGRAVDLGVLVKRDGTRLDVLRDWGGAIGDRSCGPEATAPRQDSPAARELRGLVCEASARGIFHLILTPNFNSAHRNHFHLDIEPKRTSAEVK